MLSTRRNEGVHAAEKRVRWWNRRRQPCLRKDTSTLATTIFIFLTSSCTVAAICSPAPLTSTTIHPSPFPHRMKINDSIKHSTAMERIPTECTDGWNRWRQPCLHHPTGALATFMAKPSTKFLHGCRNLSRCPSPLRGRSLLLQPQV